LGYAIIFAADKKEPEIALYEDVEKQVQEDYIGSKSQAMAKETAEAMLTALKVEGSESFATEAAKLEITPETSDYITRGPTAGSKLPAQVVNLGFELSDENPYPEEVISVNDIYYVFRVMEKRSPSSELFSEKESDFGTGLLERKKSAILASWLANVREKAEIEINEQFL
jgi:hypothetical protein